MTVRENLDLGAYLRRDARHRRATSSASSTLFPRLKEREKQKAGTMSGGEQQMLAIGRALMAEPAAAAARRAVDGPRAGPGRAHLRDDRGDQPQGTTILLVEQNANYALDVSNARLRARDRAGGADRRRPQRCARTPRSRRRTWAHDRLRAASARKALYLLFIWLVSAIAASLAVGPQGLRREAGPGHGPAPERRRRDRLAVVAGARGLALEGPGRDPEARRPTVAEARAERQEKERREG